METGKHSTTTVQIFKLVTGEEIIATVEVDPFDRKEYLTKPRNIALQKMQNGAVGIALLPWLVSAGDNKFQINNSTIIVQLIEKFIEPEILNMYLQQVTGIAIAGANSISKIKSN